MRGSLLPLTAVLLLACSEAEPTGGDAAALFEFTDVTPGVGFVIRLEDPARIAEARAILRGEQLDRTHVLGRIVKTTAPYNSAWSYHLDPQSVEFFENSIEVCDATMQYVEDHLEEVGGAFLPDGFWCPWSSKLTREL
jgi:hypothetical protein